MFKQAAREPDDGMVRIEKTTDDKGRDRIQLVCGDQVIECSFYNAARLFGMLALMLEIPLSKAVGKAIKFGPNTEMGIK